ncbi:tetratricopeptide repeat protein [Streptomyces genisteinicus]|uniref:Tetratricopeptide repeat protein n=1 Tax=Streptomyces genisteinicus TaxID=2768068 RepID=A0A7H0HSD2_9ACTN|nr:tetratricopeptide repeat protein [Streptomyces genisteinicus]QNP63448.1 tetratricopeptide repeat protein [Streptomyces genisteinicus]
MASSSRTPGAPNARPAHPNPVFRRLRGSRSPGEFATAVRRAAREIGEQVSCDARYIGRVESGEIRCPNYAYERVFLHMFPGRTLTDLGFAAREDVRGRGRGPAPAPAVAPHAPHDGVPRTAAPDTPDAPVPHSPHSDIDEESDVLRRAFMIGGTVTAAATLGHGPESVPVQRRRRVGDAEAEAVEEAVRRIRLLDDRHGADGLYQQAAQPLRAAYALLDSGTAARASTAHRLQAGAGELAISVGWLAHDSGRFAEARSHYAEALATARVAGDPGLEAHAFCNTSFLARDAGRYREAVRTAQAGRQAARAVRSSRLSALLALREAGGWAGLGDRASCEQSLARAHGHFARGPAAADPEWMSFFAEPELEALQAQCWSALGDWARAARHARRAATLQDHRFTRNLALYRAELACDLARAGVPDEAAAAGDQVLALLGHVRSSRIHAMLADTAAVLRPHRAAAGVGGFLERYEGAALRA